MGRSGTLRGVGFLAQWLALLTLALLSAVVRGETPAHQPGELPRFTEEREAAARFFVKKHLPELLPLLDQVKANNPPRYELEIREIFLVTEILADLRDQPRRYYLELEIWKKENRANTLIARLATPSSHERKKIEGQIQELARELVELDLQVLDLKAEQLEKELADVKDEAARIRAHADREARDRFDRLMLRLQKRKK